MYGYWLVNHICFDEWQCFLGLVGRHGKMIGKSLSSIRKKMLQLSTASVWPSLIHRIKRIDDRYKLRVNTYCTCRKHRLLHVITEPATEWPVNRFVPGAFGSMYRRYAYCCG